MLHGWLSVCATLRVLQGVPKGAQELRMRRASPCQIYTARRKRQTRATMPRVQISHAVSGPDPSAERRGVTTLSHPHANGFMSTVSQRRFHADGGQELVSQFRRILRPPLAI